MRPVCLDAGFIHAKATQSFPKLNQTFWKSPSGAVTVDGLFYVPPSVSAGRLMVVTMTTGTVEWLIADDPDAGRHTNPSLYNDGSFGRALL